MADFESSRALIVGINEYSNGVPALRSAVNDVQGLAKILSADHGYSVTLLLDHEATLDGLKHHFEEVLPQQVGTGDRVLVYFAGHGIAEDGEDGPTGYLLPRDARRDDRASFLRMETFRNWLAKLRCRHLLVILDCCFAGAFRWTKETRHVRPLLEVIHRERYERFIRNPAWQAIASAAYDQEALDAIAGKVLGRRRPAADNTPNSPFARALFEGLKGSADLTGDGVIMAYELATFLRDQVSLSAHHARHEQMPSIWSLGKNDSGEYIFLVPGHPLNLPPAPELTEENNPYRGLRVYKEKHADLFFGREKVVEDLAEVVKKQTLTMVLGASGTGKSSLVRAGLLSYPRKLVAAAGADAAGASDAVLFGKDAGSGGDSHRLLMRPADTPATPVRGLIMRLNQVAEAGAALSESATDATPASALSVFSAWFAADTQRHLLLVIDQCEELVTVCNTDVRTRFLGFLADLIDREGTRLRVVLTLRSDFEPQFHESALQRHLAAEERPSAARFVVPPLQHDELREIIEKPASKRVLFFEPPALVDRLVTEVIQMPGALPLLSFALSELYLKYVERQQAAQQRGAIIDRTITEEDYKKLGGVVGALSRRATDEYEACDDAHRRTMRKVLLRMVATEGELARRRVPRSELEYPDTDETERANTVVERLETARLVVSGRTNAGDAADGGGDYVEPAHDELVRSWGKLLEWQRQAADDLPVQRRLTEAASEWIRQNRAPGLLWAFDPRLPLVRQHLAAQDHCLNSLEIAFIEASVKRLARSEVNESRAMVALAGYEAQHGSLAKALRIALTAVPPNLALPDRAYFRQAEGTIGRILRDLRELRRFPGHGSGMLSIAFSADGRALATTSYDTTTRLWDAANGTEICVLRGHDGYVYAVALSPDGRTLATGSTDKTARLWDVATGKESCVLRGHEHDLRSVAFSPDGRTLATGSRDETARLWDVRTGKQIGLPLCHESPVEAVAFSPDEHTLATACFNSARVWNLATGKQLGRPLGREGLVLSVAFSPDGHTLATGSGKTVRFWDPASGKENGALLGHEDQVLSVAFRPDGKLLATGSRDRTARLWDVATGKEMCVLRGHENWVNAVAFSPDRNVLATGGEDGTARLWCAAVQNDIGAPYDLEGATVGALTTIAFSADGNFVITGSNDHTVRLWEASSGKQIRVLFHDRGEVESLAFSPDGRTLATAWDNHMVLLWDVASQKEVGTQLRHDCRVTSVTFSPDGRTLATGSEDNTARLWDVASHEEIGALLGHEDTVLSVAFSTDGCTLATGSWDRSVRLWDIDSRKEIGALLGHEGGVSSVAFSPDGHTLASASWDCSVRLWDIASRKEIGLLLHHEDTVLEDIVLSVAFSPDGRSLATGLEDAAQLWDVGSRREIAAYESGAHPVAFSPNGRMLATSSENGWLRLWAIGQGLVDLACARVHELPLSDSDKERFGIDNEWCTPEVSGALRAKLGFDAPAAPAATAAR